jgi:hypothetical protein
MSAKPIVAFLKPIRKQEGSPSRALAGVSFRS